jgi:hypothetical protein
MKWEYWWLSLKMKGMWRFLQTLPGGLVLGWILGLGLILLMVVGLVRSCRERQEIYRSVFATENGVRRKEQVIKDSLENVLGNVGWKKDSVFGVLDTMSVDAKRKRAKAAYRARHSK